MNGSGRSHDATIFGVDDEPDLEALVLQKYARYAGNFSRITLAGDGFFETSRRSACLPSTQDRKRAARGQSDTIDPLVEISND